MPLIDDAALRDPEATYRPVAMWFLNGDLEDAEVVRQVRAMAEGGVGGIQVAARTGLTVPYLSERWFSLIRTILDEAGECGMEVWLADEYPYPSGASGGEVILRHPEYRAWTMRATHFTVAPGERVQRVAPGTVLLRACAVPYVDGVARGDRVVSLEGHAGIVQHEQVFFQPTTTYNTTRRYMVNGPRPTLEWRAPEGAETWEVWLIAAGEIERYKFFGGYVDLCNPDAVRFFIETTYERYLERLGEAHWKKLTGFFVDESHPQNWSWHLPGFFKQRCGYDLIEALPALWTDVGERTARVRYDYMQSLTELFVESFHKPLAQWCKDHGVLLSLEVGSTRNVVQRYADVAGIDPGHNKVGTSLEEIFERELGIFRNNLTFPASLASQMGRRRVLDEVFHSVGWSLTLQDMKSMLDHAAARGANLFAFHGFCYTIGGLKKWDAPPSEFDQNPYWAHFERLAGYAGRLGYLCSRGRRVAPVALVDPITSLWAHGGAVREPAIGAGPDAMAKRILGDWTYLMRELTAAQRPHDTIDPSLLAEATVRDGALCLGEAEYRVLVLPPMCTLEASAWEALEKFVAGGGTVVGCGLLPCEAIEAGSAVVERCAAAFGVNAQEVRGEYEGRSTASTTPAGSQGQAAGSGKAGFRLIRSQGTLREAGAAGAVLEVLDELGPVDLRVMPVDGGHTRELLLGQRREGDEDVFLVVNESMQEREVELVARMGTGERVSIEMGDLETGVRRPAGVGPDGKSVPQRLARYGACAVVVKRAPATAASRAVTQDRPYSGTGGIDVGEDLRVLPRWGRLEGPVVELEVSGEWACEPAGENALRLDRFRFWMSEAGDEDAGRATERVGAEGALVIEPKPLVNVLQDLSRDGKAWPVAVSVTPAFGAPPVLRPELPATCWYEASFGVTQVPQGAVLCLEEDALQGRWAIWVNGERVANEAFTRHRRWDHSNREATIADLLKDGVNRVLVRVEVTETWDGLIEPLYVLGNFGVELGQAEQTAAP